MSSIVSIDDQWPLRQAALLLGICNMHELPHDKPLRASCLEAQGSGFGFQVSGHGLLLLRNLFPVVTMYHEGAVPIHSVERHLQYSGCWTVTYTRVCISGPLGLLHRTIGPYI